jgi:hypothetical protein
MKEVCFRAAALPQFSAEPSNVRLQRRESGNKDADQTQGATRNGARGAGEFRCMRSRAALSFLLQSERASVVSQAPAYQRALTPPGMLIRLVSKNLLKTGAWAVRRVLVHDHGRALAEVGFRPSPIPPARVIRKAARRSGSPRAASAAAKTACGSRPPQPEGRSMGRGMSLASLQRSPRMRSGALQESER